MQQEVVQESLLAAIMATQQGLVADPQEQAEDGKLIDDEASRVMGMAMEYSVSLIEPGAL